MNIFNRKNEEQIREISSAPPRPALRLFRLSNWQLGVIFVAGAVVIYLLVKWISPAPQIQLGGRFGGGPMAVAVAKAEKGEIRVILNALGTVTPLNTVTVVTQINGQMQQVGFQEGQVVHQGDFLAQIDPRPYEALLESAQGALARDEAQLQGARVDLARYEALLKQDSIASQTVDTQRALVKQLEGAATADRGTVDTQKLNIAYCHIVSPITGRIGLRQIDPGNYVTVNNASGTGIAVVTQTAPISVIFPIPENNLPDVMKRIRDGATLTVSALDKDNVATIATGKLANVDNQIDPTTGTVKLRAVFDNMDERLFPNQFVNIQLLVDTLQDQTIIPTSAIETGAPGTFVYLVNPDSTVSVRPVKLGAVDGTRRAIVSGLALGEVVVTEGVDRLRDGALVTLPGATPRTVPPNARPGGRNGQGRPPGGGRQRGGQGGQAQGSPTQASPTQGGPAQQ